MSVFSGRNPRYVDGRWHCPVCALPMEERMGSMHWRGRDFAGLVCVACNSLWDNPHDSMLAYAREGNSQRDGQ